MYVLYVCMWFNRLLSNYSAPETAAEPIASGEGVSRTLIRAMGRSQVYLVQILWDENSNIFSTYINDYYT